MQAIVTNDPPMLSYKVASVTQYLKSVNCRICQFRIAKVYTNLNADLANVLKV